MSWKYDNEYNGDYYDNPDDDEADDDEADDDEADDDYDELHTLHRARG